MGAAVESRTYQRQGAAVFFRTKEEFGGLSNMAPGFPLRVNGVTILTTEALYQACRFPHLPDVQRLIIAQKSPMTAKMKSKPYRSQSRPDWTAVRVRVMRWCLRVKLACSEPRFRKLLLATGDRPIVEESRKDEFWGAKAQADGTLAGKNVLGRLLMELRAEIRDAASEAVSQVEPPQIANFLLLGEGIHTVGIRHPVKLVTTPLFSPGPALTIEWRPGQTGAELSPPASSVSEGSSLPLDFAGPGMKARRA